MELQTLISNVYRAYKGKSSKAPSSGTSDYNDVLSLINQKQEEWARDPYVSWRSLYRERESGTIISGIQEYELEEDFHRAAEYIYVDVDDNREERFPVITPSNANIHNRSVFIVGRTLYFTDDIKEDDSIVDGTLRVPQYILPEDLSDSRDETAVDDPYWLIESVAAELARNDPAKERHFPNLIAMANDKYQKMKTENEILPYRQRNAAVSEMPATGESW